jgi:hypothetical protein
VNSPVESAHKAWTEAELKALPDDGYLHELVDGELVMSPKNDPYHGDICHSLTQRELLGPGADLDGETLLPGFRYPIEDLFKEWDWA